MRRLAQAYDRWWSRHYLFPQFDAVGDHTEAVSPYAVTVFGEGVRLGRHVHLRATKDRQVHFTTWRTHDDDGVRQGEIHVGDYVLIMPGCRLTSSCHIEIGAGTMLASNCYVTDSDWHDTYDRTNEGTKYAPVVIGENCWLGDSVIVCKGVHIGKNSIVGAGSVVTRHVPPNVIVAGNPAEIVRALDPSGPFKTRAEYLEYFAAHAGDMERLHKQHLKGNSTLGLLRSLFFPTRRD